MTHFDLVLRGGAAILPGHGRATCDIAVRDGRIGAIVAPGEQLAAATEISVRGLTVFPGALDVHLHLGHGKDIAQPRVPLDADRETAAAAKGGVYFAATSTPSRPIMCIAMPPPRREASGRPRRVVLASRLCCRCCSPKAIRSAACHLSASSRYRQPPRRD
jgi:hypothetical protein